ncbi:MULTISPECIES: hypothetical protein [unclassified Streptomyces]|uniref:hypothetical protein n=1 Tax=unclassified Streptomyces TaxID=2593676 RepID=UPI002250FBB7|nr:MULTISPECIES: hypothetical protein [unclassified Streptomyces]MCX5052095.1 hypothetical protein [Streptomyces sp. NBC_00474]
MAFGISFTRTFKHTPWIDAVDRVSAAGDNGFNIRFKGLEEDLDTIGERFTTVSAALDSLVRVGGAERTLVIPPLLTPVGGASGWDLSTTPGTASVFGEVDAVGITGAVPVTLPGAGRILGFQAFGAIGQVAEVRVDLTRRSLGANGDEAVIVRIQASESAAFRERPPDPSKARIDPQAAYYITARVGGTSVLSSVTLTGFRVRYQES